MSNFEIPQRYINNYIRIITLLLTGIMIGYVLHPVPRWILYLLENSNLFKFMILFYAGYIATYPMDKQKFYIVLGGSIGILFLFHLARKLDDVIDRIEIEKKRKKQQKEQEKY